MTLDRFELDVPVPPANTITVVRSSNAVTTVVQSNTQLSAGDSSGTNGNISPSTRVATTAALTQVATGSSNQVSSTMVASSNASSLFVPSVSTTVGSQQSGGDSSTSLLSSTISMSGVNTNGTASPFPGAPPITGASHNTPLGAIIGGALGGLAAIAILIILIFWLRMRRKSTR